MSTLERNRRRVRLPSSTSPRERLLPFLFSFASIDSFARAHERGRSFKLVARARTRILGSASCWHTPFGDLWPDNQPHDCAYARRRTDVPGRSAQAKPRVARLDIVGRLL